MPATARLLVLILLGLAGSAIVQAGAPEISSQDATDPPDDPLTTSLSAALAGDLTGTTPARFLELTVGVEAPLGRTQRWTRATPWGACSRAPSTRPRPSWT